MGCQRKRSSGLVVLGFGILIICGYFESQVSAELDSEEKYLKVADELASRSIRSAKDLPCKNAVKKVRLGQLKRHCQSYNRTNNGGVCRKYLGNDLLFANSDYQGKAESNVVLLTRILSSIVTLLRVRIPGRCRRALIESACRQEIPLCDLSRRQPRPLRMCKSSCQFVIQQKCGDILKKIETLPKSREQHLFIQRFQTYIKSRCNELPSQYDSSYIPCYSIFNKERYEMISGSDHCYDENSIKYTGPISTTASGRPCQPWKNQCPHRHPFTLNTYPELFNAGNACRDPGGIRGRPWCYVNDRKTRWQYCNIMKCSEKPTTLPTESTTAATTKEINYTPTDCKGNTCDSTARNECEKDLDGKCMQIQTIKSCNSNEECGNDVTSSKQIKTKEEYLKDDISLKPWIIYLLIAIGGTLAVLLFVLVLLKVKQKKKRKDLQSSTGGTSLASNYDSDSVDDEERGSCLKKQLSQDSFTKCCDTEIAIDDIDPRFTVQV